MGGFVNERAKFEKAAALNVKCFGCLDEEWLKFIKINRSKGGLQRNYNVVIEAVVDDNNRESILRFYLLEIYKTLQETENGLWDESTEYIADRYYEEENQKYRIWRIYKKLQSYQNVRNKAEM